MKITAENFEQATGRKPEQDDLQRSNCPKAGKPGHDMCGWCFTHNGPQFECGCALKAKHEKASI